jgi:hypothetical protein
LGNNPFGYAQKMNNQGTKGQKNVFITPFGASSVSQTTIKGT